MTEREKQHRKEKATKVCNGIDKGVSVVKTIFSIIGLIAGGLVIYSLFSAGSAVYNAITGFFGG